MKLRYRLTLGIGFLFALILLLGIQSVSYVRQLSKSSKEILADNYNSLHYAKDMLRSLDRISRDSASRQTLIRSLELQRENITEANEREVTAALGDKIAALTDSMTDTEIRLIRDDLYRIMELNMTSIRMKSSDTATRAADAMWSLTIVSVLCVLLAMIFLIRFPAIVLRPIDRLKQGITQIANHNYDQRLDFGDGNRVESNRGCSGIEGSTSTAIGDAMASAPRAVVLVTGDMSAAYDVGALAVRDIPDTFRMVVLDNGGGDIFRAVATTRDLPEREQLFAVPPRLPLKALSEAYGFRYFDSDSDGFAACPSRAVLHLHVPQGDCLNVM